MGAKKSLTNLILLILEKTVDSYVVFEDFAYNPMLVGRDLKQSDLSRALQRLRERGLIELVSDKKLAYRLTDPGRQKAIWQNLMVEDNNEWDGKWRIVTFDIPETRKRARHLLRRNLKNWGFVAWQKSVWATRKNCTEVLRHFIKNAGIENWVLVLESDNVGRKM